MVVGVGRRPLPDAPLMSTLLIVAAVLQALAVAYAAVLVTRRRAAAGAWLCLLGAMLSMLAWRVVIVTGIEPPQFFNPVIAIWGSSCMVVAMFLFGREVARRERAEAERDALLTSERAARTEAEGANRIKDDFLATLSHELRSPLAAIIGWCTLLRLRRDVPGGTDRAIDTIERNARAQARLVDDLLDVTRLQAGTLYLDSAPVRLDGPVSAAIDAVRPAAESKGLTVVFRREGDVPVVTGDAGRLQQIAANLIGNAVKFTSPGGHVTVSLSIASDRARLAVEDDGEGMDAAFLPHVFARFRQADSTVARRHGGVGLGLSIVASLVRLHGGEAAAASEGPGRGSRFVVTFPLAPDVRAPEAHQVVQGARGLAGLRILVVDDEHDVRSVVASLLEASGAAVVALQSGATVEAALATFKPDLLVIDIGMPDEDGYALIGRIRRLAADSGGRVPAVSLTAHARNEDRARALASGFQEHLAKPIDLPLLVSTIRRLVVDAPAASPPDTESARDARETEEGQAHSAPQAGLSGRRSAVPTGVPSPETRRQELAGGGLAPSRPIEHDSPVSIRSLVVFALLIASFGVACSEALPPPLKVERNLLTVDNRTDKDWLGVEIWINRQYRITTPRIAARTRFSSTLDMFVAGWGQRFDIRRQRVDLIVLTAHTPDGTPVSHTLGSAQPAKKP
jgi:signal transduction histidine kinase/CheY-like chemotaxis protein